MSIEEIKRIFTFPDEYIVNGKFEEKWAGIGNSVPPMMMKAIAETVRDRILDPIYAEQIQ